MLSLLIPIKHIWDIFFHHQGKLQLYIFRLQNRKGPQASNDFADQDKFKLREQRHYFMDILHTHREQLNMSTL